jgi:hypothetical protein
MGLDMYAYVAAREGTEWDDATRQDLAYWRKHPHLHRWMEQLAERKGLEYGSFNGVELELEWCDIEQLEEAVSQGQLPPAQGFFWGNDADEYYRDHDLEFIKQARAELFLKRRVFYNSSW